MLRQSMYYGNKYLPDREKERLCGWHRLFFFYAKVRIWKSAHSDFQIIFLLLPWKNHIMNLSGHRKRISGVCQGQRKRTLSGHVIGEGLMMLQKGVVGAHERHKRIFKTD